MDFVVACKVQTPLTSMTSPVAQTAQPGKRADLDPRGTILVVDDETSLRRSCRRVLQQAGYEALEADSVPSAKELWKASSAKVVAVLTDYEMPGPKGVHLCEWLHDRNPRVALILMSATHANDLPIPPYVSFLSKPFGLKELTDAVQRQIQQSQA